MSMPEQQLPTSPEGLQSGTYEPQSPDQVKLNDSNNYEAKVTGTTSSNEAGPARAPINALREFMASLKKPSDGKCFRCLCPDGVFRILTWLPTPHDQTTDIAVYDGLPMSLTLIKAYLDRKPWNQATEDRFRGVDRRRVLREQWLQPLPGVLPSMGSFNQREEERRRWKEERKLLDEMIARGEISDDAGLACGSVQSNFDLRPRGGLLSLIANNMSFS